ncbi:MAG: tyrosine--tRNA ligase [Bacteroidetes bacterium]|nr:tyrosine--tRNA ligase [Bacteroidota bacterium]
MNLIKELEWRGMIQNIMPGTEAQLEKEMTTAYIGFDPTADSLHIGSLVQIILLIHLQKAGHKPIALVGGATGMIGDPSMKNEERVLLDEKQLNMNLEGIKRQLEKFLDFDDNKKNAAEILNNYDWFKQISFIQFLRETGKHITINYMMAKDSVKKRIESETGISYTEFAYQLMQGYDFFWLYEHKNCKVQMGGSDQWGNIVTGTELIRRKSGGEAFAFTCPLITKADGGKFGKTESGNVWLDAEKTTPYQFYQFWLNASDEDAKKWLKIFTFLEKEIIDQLILEHDADPSLRIVQHKLAKEVTLFVHGPESLQAAEDTTKKLFAAKNAPAETLSLEDLENIEGIVKLKIEKNSLLSGIDIVSFLSSLQILPSKSEAKKLLQNGGVSINRKKITDLQAVINNHFLLHEKYILVQKGKKNYFLVEAY